MGPLRETCEDMTNQRDSLTKELEILRTEADRWKTRTNHLIEQCNKFDPEEHKKTMLVPVDLVQLHFNLL